MVKDEVVAKIDKQIEGLKYEKKRHIADKKIEKNATEETKQLTDNLKQLLDEKVCNEDFYKEDLGELLIKCHQLFKQNKKGIADAYTKHELTELLDVEIFSQKEGLDEFVKSKQAYIDSLMELKILVNKYESV